MSTDSNSTFSNFIVAAGVILAVSYPVLAISTGFRAVFQLLEQEPSNSPWLTMVAALCYTVATIGFAKQPRDRAQAPKPARTPFGKWWQALTPAAAWRISVYVLIFESIMTVIVGGLSVAGFEIFGRNVWQFFGADYGYLPLIQPLLGILWLFNPVTMRRYDIRK
ncbi:MAG: hypothetical protein ACPG8W_08840 [Candidatus Promineifilaceae bacterium]